MSDEVGVKQSFENLSNIQGDGNRKSTVVRGVGAVTLLRNWLNKCVLPRRSISAGIKDKAKMTTMSHDNEN